MTRSSKLLVRSALFTLAFGALGCGSEGGGKVPSSRKLSALTDSDAKSLCKEISRSAGKLIETECTLAALEESFYWGEDVSCEEARDECVELLALDCNQAQVDSDFADCDATVGELRQCQRDQVALADKIFAELTCDSDLESFEEDLEVENLESCAKLADKCPSVFGDEEDVSFEAARRFVARVRR